MRIALLAAVSAMRVDSDGLPAVGLLAAVASLASEAHPTSTDRCVVLCDVPEHSNSMQGFRSVLDSCRRDGGLVFVDPNIGNPRGVRDFGTERFATTAEVLGATTEGLFLGNADEAKVGESSAAGEGVFFWRRYGLRHYTGVPLTADSPYLAEALHEVAPAPAKILDGVCPGTEAGRCQGGACPRNPGAVLDEARHYDQLARAMGEHSELISVRDGGGFVHMNRSEVRALADQRAREAQEDT